MNNPDPFERDRVIFAVGLLAVLFATMPAYPALAAMQIHYLDGQIRMSHGYLGLAAMLGLAVYAYAWSVLPITGNKFSKNLGDLAYALGLAVPPPFIAAFFLLKIPDWLHWPKFYSLGYALGVSIGFTILSYSLTGKAKRGIKAESATQSRDRSKLRQTTLKEKSDW